MGSPSLPFHTYQLTMDSRGNVGSFEDPLLDHSPILGGHLDSKVTACFISTCEAMKGGAQRKGWKYEMVIVAAIHCDHSDSTSMYWYKLILAHLTWTTYMKFLFWHVLTLKIFWKGALAHCIWHLSSFVWGLVIYFLDPPLLDMDFTQLASMAELELSERGLTRIFEKLIANRLVLPNVWFRPFLQNDTWPKTEQLLDNALWEMELWDFARWQDVQDVIAKMNLRLFGIFSL